jgi:hypothetical protein
MRMEFNVYRIMRVYSDERDLCRDCENFGKCPLIRALKDDLAVIRHESVSIEKCKFYQKRGNKQCQR